MGPLQFWSRMDIHQPVTEFAQCMACNARKTGEQLLLTNDNTAIRMNETNIFGIGFDTSWFPRVFFVNILLAGYIEIQVLTHSG